MTLAVNAHGTAPTPRVSAAPATILLVEDDEPLRDLVRTVLRRHGYAVLESGNGEAALVELAARQHAIDLLMSDVVLPGISGPDLVRRLAADRAAPRVLYLTGYSEQECVRRGWLRPGDAALAKPFTPRALAEKVAAVLAVPTTTN